MTTIDYDDAPALLPQRTSRVDNPLRTLFRWLKRRREERLTLFELSRLDAHLLRDMGIEPGDVLDALNGRRDSLLFNPLRRHRDSE